MLRGLRWPSKSTPPEIFFVIFGSLFGLLFVFLTPPLQGPDEQAHFAQVYRYSEGKISPTSDLPKGIVQTYKTIFYEDDIRFFGNEKYELGRTKHALLEVPLEKDIRVDGVSYTGTGYSPLAYLPSTLLVSLGRQVDLPAIVLIYFARIGSLVMFLLLMYAAIRVIPIAKVPFMVVGLIPMTVFTSSMVSTDAATIGFAGLFISLVLRATLQKATLSKKDTLPLSLAAAGIMLTKIINVFLLPLVLLILFKKDKGDSKKIKSMITVATLAAGILALIIWQSVAIGVPADSVSNIPKNVIPAEQVKLMFEAPYKFGFALWNTYFYNWGDGTLQSLIGNFGWVDTPMSMTFIILGYIVLFLALVSNRQTDELAITKLKKLPRAGTIAVTLLYILGVNAGMYVYYSPVDYNIIVGLQGRYFIPALLLASICLISERFNIDAKTYNFITRVVPVFLLMVSCIYVFLRYYIDTRI